MYSSFVKHKKVINRTKRKAPNECSISHAISYISCIRRQQMDSRSYFSTVTFKSLKREMLTEKAYQTGCIVTQPLLALRNIHAVFSRFNTDDPFVIFTPWEQSGFLGNGTRDI